MRACIYVRVSTDEQAREGYSMAAQEDACRAYATMRCMEVVEVVIDAGVSAGKPLSEREGGRRVIGLVENRQVHAVVAWKLDRLFRDCADCLTTTRAWDRADVSLHLVDLGGQAIDTRSAMGRFFLTVMAAAAELERNQIRERTRWALAEAQRAGVKLGRPSFAELRAGVRPGAVSKRAQRRLDEAAHALRVVTDRRLP